MKKPLLLIGFAFALIAFTPSTQAVGEVCGDGTNNCCTAPAIVEEGGGCGPTRAWIGSESTGSCQEPPASGYPCAASFRCSTNSCTSTGGGPACPGGTVNLGGGVCAPKLTVFQDTVTTTLAKLWNGDILGRMVYVADADCADGEVPTWDNTAKEWVCGAGGGGSSPWDVETTFQRDIYWNGFGVNGNTAYIGQGELGGIALYDQALQVNSRRNAGIHIKANQNDNGLNYGSYLHFDRGTQGSDTTNLQAVVGLTPQTSGEDPMNNPYTGAGANTLLIGTTDGPSTADIIQFGINGEVKMTMDGSGGLGFNAGPLTSFRTGVNIGRGSGNSSTTVRMHGKTLDHYNDIYTFNGTSASAGVENGLRIETQYDEGSSSSSGPFNTIRLNQRNHNNTNTALEVNELGGVEIDGPPNDIAALEVGNNNGDPSIEGRNALYIDGDTGLGQDLHLNNYSSGNVRVVEGGGDVYIGTGSWMRIDPSAEEIGVGTINPAAALHIQVSSGNNGSWDDGGIKIKNTHSTEGEAALSFGNGTTGSNWWITGLNQNNDYVLAYGNEFTSSTAKVYFHDGGQVSVGSADTDAHLIVDAPTGSNPFRVRENGTTRFVVKEDNNTSLNDNELHDVKALQLKDWDDNTGGADNKYRLLARDGAFQFYDGGVLVGNYGNGTWSDLGNGQLVVEGAVAIGNNHFSAAAELHILDDNSGDQRSLIVDSDGETSDIAFLVRTDPDISGTLDHEDDSKFVIRGNGRVGIGYNVGREDPAGLLHLNSFYTDNGSWNDGGILIDNTCAATPETVCPGASNSTADASEAAIALRGYVNDYCPPGSTCAVNVTNSDWWMMGLNQNNRLTWHYGTGMQDSTELMRLAPNGDLFVDNDITAYEDMFVDDSLVVGDEAHWRRDNLGASTLWKTYASDNADGDTFVWNSEGAGQVRMYLKENGDLILDGSVNPWSDARLKEDVRTVDGALDKIEQLRGVYYKWNHKEHDKGDHLGLIAQEVKEVLPELVVGTGEMMEFDGGMEMDYYRMDYDGLTALLIEGIKEQQATIDTLTKRVEELEEAKVN